MSVFMVRRTLPHVPLDAIRAAIDRILVTASEMTAEGQPLRYLSSTYVPSTGSCSCVFAADSIETVRCANDRAAVPFDEILPARSLL